jgi:riboflavin synthase
LFTGLIVEMGEVVSVARKESGVRLHMKADTLATDTGIGDSISINGTCLTVVEMKGTTLAFDLSEETLTSTNLGQLKSRDRVNLEPSLSMGSKLGGHFVTGHIDGIGTIRSKENLGTAFKIVISTGPRITDFLVEKGSVAVDGISLTVVDVLRDGFSIVIIPHTAKMTTIGFKEAGDSVNIEVDILGKYVSKLLNKNKGERFMETLSKEGFM